MRREFVTNGPERRGSATARGATWGSTRRPGGEGKMWERAIAVAAAGRTGEAARAGLVWQVGVSSVGSGAYGLPLPVRFLARGDSGRGRWPGV